jgi:hypothetical protein
MMETILRLGVHMGIDLLFTALVVFAVYARRHGRNEYVFTYVMFNLITFTLCFLLQAAPIELGFALGLFAVFGILRYRTEPIRIHELTYLFIVIGIGILNAVAHETTGLGVIVAVNSVIVSVTALLEYVPWFSGSQRLRVVYDDLARLQSADKTALLEDLSARTGLPIEKASIEEIDLLRETARLTLYYLR